MNQVRLLLDEHYAPHLAATLRAEGFDAEALLDVPGRAGLSDPEVFLLPAASGRRIVTENVRDFRPLLVAAGADRTASAPLLLVRGLRFPRAGGAPALVTALRAWLQQPGVEQRPEEDWL